MVLKKKTFLLALFLTIFFIMGYVFFSIFYSAKEGIILEEKNYVFYPYEKKQEVNYSEAHYLGDFLCPQGFLWKGYYQSEDTNKNKIVCEENNGKKKVEILKTIHPSFVFENKKKNNLDGVDVLFSKAESLYVAEFLLHYDLIEVRCENCDFSYFLQVVKSFISNEGE